MKLRLGDDVDAAMVNGSIGGPHQNRHAVIHIAETAADGVERSHFSGIIVFGSGLESHGVSSQENANARAAEIVKAFEERDRLLAENTRLRERIAAVDRSLDDVADDLRAALGRLI